MRTFDKYAHQPKNVPPNENMDMYVDTCCPHQPSKIPHAKSTYVQVHNCNDTDVGEFCGGLCAHRHFITVYNA